MWRVEDVDAYVRKILVNANRSRFRSKRPLEYSVAAVPEYPAWPPDDGSGVEERAVLFAALATLPPRQRAIVVLRYWEDLGEGEVAALVGCSVGTVKSQASRALAKLRNDARLAGLSAFQEPAAAMKGAQQPMTDEAWENGLREVMAGAAGSTRVAPPPTEAILRGGRSWLRLRNGLTGSGVLGMVAAAVIVGTSLRRRRDCRFRPAGRHDVHLGAAAAGAGRSGHPRAGIGEDEGGRLRGLPLPAVPGRRSWTSAYLTQEADSGKIQVEYRAVNLIDRNGQTPGSGSTAAGNAVQCAANRGDFSAYRSAVYAHQPQEKLDAFTSSALLITIARRSQGWTPRRSRSVWTISRTRRR